uniref:TMC domain-containing protein n=1 Tax=Caenorhabditis japonica TaxID=281687 RepID=A0A8R1DXW6_CAEJA
MSGIEVLPEGLQNNPLVQRRASVFLDLITVFRKNTVHRLAQNTHDHIPNRPESWGSIQETDAFITRGEKQKETDDDGNPLTRQALLERIRQKKEVIGKLRCQAWSMTRKRRTLKLAQKYLEQHESKVSRSHLYMEEMRKRARMAANARMSKLSGSKAEQYIFNWKLFTGWDYTIGNSETASNTVMAVVIKLRESIADCKKDSHGKFRLLQFTLRVFANVVICAMLGFSIYCIIFAVQKSQVQDDGNLFTKNQVPSVVSTITHVFPMIFDLIGRMENYHPRTALRAHLGRVLILYTVNYITLIFALFEKMTALRERVNHSAEPMSREKRQQGGWNPNFQRPPPFASRSEIRQMSDFIAENSRRFQTVTQRTTRSIATPFTVAPQYGPFNVNNPNAILHNGSHSTSFESQLLGPKVLPIFTPPPRKYPNRYSNGVDQQFGGPDFAKSATYLKSTPLPRVRTKPPWSYTTTVPPKIQTRPSARTPVLTDAVDILISREDTEHPKDYDSLLNGTIHAKDAALRQNHDGYNTDICWETIIGQEIVKLVTMDLIFTILSILVIDFLRGLWIKYCSSWWCWDIETTFPEYGEFKVAENVLHIINNQGMIWLGLFFAPLLPAINNIKLIVLMYIRGWAVMTCNVPAREIFRASRSSNFYLGILLIWLLLCTLPVGFVIASMSPSRSCGPFARYQHFYTVVTREIEKRVDQTVLSYIRHIASPGVVIPIILFLILIIYFLFSLVRGLREANTDLQAQLVHERTEEKKKIFELAGGKKNKFEKDNKRKITNEHVPLIEQRRREPWRQYHEIENEHVLASDSSEESSLSDGEDDERQLMVSVPSKITESPSETLQVTAFHPSLGSLIENKELEDEELSDSLPMIHKSVSFQGPTNLHMNRSISTESASQIAKNAIQVATPEEIRTLLRPYLEAKYGIPYQQGIKSFPIDICTLPNRTPSKAPSKHNSYLSLYESSKEDRQYQKNCVGLPTKEADVEEVSKEQDKQNNSSFRIKTDTSRDFLPWPSSSEAKVMREIMRTKTPLMLTKTTVETQQKNTKIGVPDSRDFKPPVPIHRKFNLQAKSETPQAEEGTSDSNIQSDSSKKRFRISVSPTKSIVPSSTSSKARKRRSLLKNLLRPVVGCKGTDGLSKSC